jgi:hypothetical protein
MGQFFCAEHAADEIVMEFDTPVKLAIDPPCAETGGEYEYCKTVRIREYLISNTQLSVIARSVGSDEAIPLYIA